jgi:hypothetical protein
MEIHVYIGVTDLAQGLTFSPHGIGLRVHRHLSPQWVEIEGASVPMFLDVVSNCVLLKNSAALISGYIPSWCILGQALTSLPPV